MNYQIFISYRRDGGESLAALLYERFARKGYDVFYDVESLRSGDFNEKLLSVIEKCEDVLLILPPGGLDRCITDENDWVKREIEHAMKCKKNIIPIMMRNFVFPDNLPESLQMLPKLNGISANMEFFDAVVERIANERLNCKPRGQAEEEREKIRQLEKSAERGDAEACNELGTMYEQNSVILVQNLKKAFVYYRKGCEAGSLAATYNLGEIYESCEEDLTLVSEYGLSEQCQYKNTEEAKTWLREQSWSYYDMAAEKGYAPAIYKKGNRYEFMLQVDMARECYEQAAKQKYYPAINALAWMYRNGIGVEVDLEKAEALYQEAAEAGYAPAVYNYANTVELKDPEKAMQLYSRVAYGDEALPIAAYALGRRYEYGMQDLKNAIQCYERALDGGISQAEDDLERCHNRLL